ncbi:MAG TPA: hypothetical protein VI669_18460 [Vicinamibacteria bacterium]
MRNFGGILLLAGVLGFFYCTGQRDTYPELPPGLSVSDSLKQPAGKWDVARYACAGIAGFGLLMAFFPKGR